MAAESLQLDPWQQTVGLLHHCAELTMDRALALRRADGRNRRHPPRPSGSFAVKGRSAEVQVTARPSRVTATVTWCDSTSCRYGDQLWRKMIARSAGICALSGTTISRGDPVYRPITSTLMPANATAMILARCIEEAYESE